MIFTGGMEALTLDQIKKKSELEEDIDFENGDFERRLLMYYFLLLFQFFYNYITSFPSQTYSESHLDLNLGWTSLTKVIFYTDVGKQITYKTVFKT